MKQLNISIHPELYEDIVNCLVFSDAQSISEFVRNAISGKVSEVIETIIAKSMYYKQKGKLVEGLAEKIRRLRDLFPSVDLGRAEKILELFNDDKPTDSDQDSKDSP
jgi:hypothetical protein